MRKSYPTLISLLICFFSFCCVVKADDHSLYMDELLKKAEQAAYSDDPQHCVSLFHAYIQAKDSLNQLDIAARMDQLRASYEADRINQKKQNEIIWTFIIFIGIVLLIASLVIFIIYIQRMKAKNYVLYRRIQEKIQKENKDVETIKQLPESELSRELRLFISLNELLEKEKLFIDPALNREELAKRLSTNRTYLIDAIRTYGDNKTVREYLNDYRLKHAASLLAQSCKLSIEQICHDSGFASRSVFYRLFRDSYGMSPAEYRKLVEEERKSDLKTNLTRLPTKKTAL